jgi:ABC-type Fe3+/spermidine/putrescine transport system ATPase subunit
MLKVKHLLSRRPAKLSGGEKQKVALARSLILDPELLLLDEPLSALDPESRENLQRELRRINQELGVTIIHVTHDCDEVQSLANRAGVMGEGRIHQIGTPEQILRKPISEFVAKFTMMRNIFPGTLKGNIFYSGTTAIIGAENKEGAEHACIRPEDVMISSEPVLSATNSFAGLITDIENKGTFVYIFVDIPPVICCQVPRHNYYQMRLCKGKNVYVSFRPDEVHVF